MIMRFLNRALDAHNHYAAALAGRLVLTASALAICVIPIVGAGCSTNSAVGGRGSSSAFIGEAGNEGGGEVAKNEADVQAQAQTQGESESRVTSGTAAQGTSGPATGISSRAMLPLTVKLSGEELEGGKLTLTARIATAVTLKGRPNLRIELPAHVKLLEGNLEEEIPLQDAGTHVEKTWSLQVDGDGEKGGAADRIRVVANLVSAGSGMSAYDVWPKSAGNGSSAAATPGAACTTSSKAEPVPAFNYKGIKVDRAIPIKKKVN